MCKLWDQIWIYYHAPQYTQAISDIVFMLFHKNVSFFVFAEIWWNWHLYSYLKICETIDLGNKNGGVFAWHEYNCDPINYEQL